MPIGIKPGETWDYQLVEDRQSDGSLDQDNTIFELAHLSAADEAKMQDELASVELPSGGEEVRMARMNTGTQILTALHRGLKGFRNFRFPDGSNVPFKRENRSKISDETLSALSSAHRQELANAIIEGTKLTEQEQD